MAYSAGLTVKKAGIPLVVIALVECAAAALPAAGVSIDKAVLYQIGISGYAAVIGAINFFKNRRRGHA